MWHFIPFGSDHSPASNRTHFTLLLCVNWRNKCLTYLLPQDPNWPGRGTMCMSQALPTALLISLGSPRGRWQRGITHARDLLGKLPVRGDGAGTREVGRATHRHAGPGPVKERGKEGVEKEVSDCNAVLKYSHQTDRKSSTQSSSSRILLLTSQ